MLDASVVHLYPVAQIVHLRHDIEIPVNIPHRTSYLSISPIFLKEFITFVQGRLIIANDFRERRLVSAQNIAVLGSVVKKRGLGLRDSILKRLETSV